MRLMLTSLAALAVAVPAAASAQSYAYDSRGVPVECQQSVNNNRLFGGLIGAAVGAAAGRSVASRGQRDEGAVLGALVGAAAGSELGRRRVACDDVAYRAQQQGWNQGYQTRPSWGDDAFEEQVWTAPRRTSFSRDARGWRQECGWGEASIRSPDGGFMREPVWMCRGPNGQWRASDR